MTNEPPAPAFDSFWVRHAWRVAAGLAMGVFATDLLTPLGLAHGVLYVPVVLLAMLSRRVAPLLWLAGACAGLVVVGYFLSPPPTAGDWANSAWLNRALALVVLMLVTPVAVVGTRLARDLRQAKARADRQSRLITMASEVGRLGGWSYDVAGQRLVWSAEVVRLHGRPVDYVPTVEAALAHYLPDDQPRIGEQLRACLKAGTPFDEQLRIRTVQGQVRWVRAVGRAVLGSDGQVVRVEGAFQDIEPIKAAQAQAQEAAERYRELLESVTDAVMALDSQWRVTVMNPQAERQTGQLAQDVLGRTLWDAFPEVRGSRFQQEYERCVATQEVVRFEEFYEPLGKRFEISAYPARDGITVVFRDVTEQRRQGEQMRQAQRLEAIGQLTGGVAHDFNNLLTVVMGNAEMLLERLPVGAPEHELARAVHQAATRGAEMTQRLLAFARRQPLSPQPVDANGLLKGMSTLLRRSLGEGVEIELVLATGLWQALVDPGELENAVLNLAINARDAMAGAGKLIIETANAQLDAEYAARQPDVQEGEYVMLAVSDTGSGIPPDVMQRLFEPFFTTKPKGQGTGLGLPMVHGFARQSNGHVSVHSEPGKGSTFRLYLPRTEASPARTALLDPDAVVLGGGELVLMVEDDDLVRAYAGALLKELNYRVIEAGNGADALVLLRQHPEVRLLFTDVVMPGGMGGRELAEAATALRPDLAVLYTSGYTEKAIVHHGRLDAGVLLLTKPYRRADLARRLRQALDGR